jgi:hypothetical protein
MSRLESCADFARILLDDFESAERVCESKSAMNLTKHEMIIRRLNTHMEMDRHMVTEVISDMRAKYAHKAGEDLKRIGKQALGGSLLPPMMGNSALAIAYYQAQAKVSVLDELLEKIESEKE